MSYHSGKAIFLIHKAIEKLDLDLTNKVVLTEIGSNNYIFTPFIPILAKAKRVIAWTKDTTYTNSETIEEEAYEILKSLHLNNSELIIRKNEFNREDINSADIITNSGFLRPINENLLKHSKKGVVIPLMFEAWELRKEDIDIDYCRNNEIKVAGTWENHPSIQVFSGVGHLAVKMALEAGFEVYQNNIIVWSNDHFGEEIEKVFKSFGASSVIKTHSKELVEQVIDGIDFIFIASYSETKSYFGNDSIFDLAVLLKKNKHFGIVHLYGNVDYEFLSSKGIHCFPNQNGHSMRMTRTLAHLGLRPIINLQVAGFRVAQHLLEETESDLIQKII